MRTIELVIFVVLLSAGRSVEAAEPTWTGDVRGFGLTVEGAKKNAVKVTLDRLTHHLNALDPPLLEWQPTEEFVEKFLLNGAGSAGPDIDIGNGGKGKSWTYPLKSPDKEQLTRLNRLALGARLLAERQVVSRERMVSAAWAFLGMLSLLGLTMAFFRIGKTISAASVPRKRSE